MKKLLTLTLSLLMAFSLCLTISAEEKTVSSADELKSAINNASENDEIVLSNDIDLTEKLTIDKKITLNIGEHTLSSKVTSNAAINITSEVTIKGSGIISNSYESRETSSPTQEAYLIQVSSGAKLTLDGVSVNPGATTTKGSTSYAVVGVYVVNGTLILNNATINGGVSNGQGDGGYGVYVFKSSATLEATDSTIIGGSLNSSGETNSGGGIAIYLQGGGNVTLKNCTVKGGSAKKTADNYYNANGGVALHLQNENNTVTVTGGSLTGGDTETTPRSGDGGVAVYTPGGSGETLTFFNVAIKGGDSNNGDGGSGFSLNGPSAVTIKENSTITGGTGGNYRGSGISFGYSSKGTFNVLNSSINVGSGAENNSFDGSAINLYGDIKLNFDNSSINGYEGKAISTSQAIIENEQLKLKNSTLKGAVCCTKTSGGGDLYEFTKGMVDAIDNENNTSVVKLDGYYFDADRSGYEFNKDSNVKVYKGDFTISDMPVGFTISNYGSGSVSVNNYNVEKDKTCIISDPELELPSTKVVNASDTESSFTYTYNGDGEISVISSNEDVAKASVDGKTINLEIIGAGEADINVSLKEGISTNEDIIYRYGTDSKTLKLTVLPTGDSKADTSTKEETKTDGTTIKKTETTVEGINIPTSEDETKVAVIDATSSDEDVSKAEVVLPNAVSKEVNEAATDNSEASVEIKTDVATLNIDNTALKTLASKAIENNDYSLKLILEKTDSTVDEKELITATYELSAIVNGTKVFDYENKATNGTITISVAYEPTNKDNSVKVYYVADDGKKTDMNARYENGVLTWKTDHFSSFEVKETKKTSSPSSTKSYSSKDKNQDGVISCEEEMNSANWIWSTTKKACVYKVSNTSVR